MDHQSSNYVMLSKKRSWIYQLGSRANYASYSGDDEASWEEQAFAEDTLMHVWPPRSYSCTFCNREFRTAQALGGHMNVHRRDRAKLQQQQPPSSPDSRDPGDRHLGNPNTPPPSEDCAARNHFPDDCNNFPSTLSAATVNKNTNVDVNTDEIPSVPKDFTRFELVVENLKCKDHSRCQADHDQLEDDQAISTKKRRVVSAEFPLFLSSTSPMEMQQQLRNEVTIKSTACQQLRNEVTIKSTACPSEELDLELRLGN